MANGNNNGMVPVLVPPQFAKFMAEFFGDKRNVIWPVANISKLPLPLDVAQTVIEKEIEGDFIYVDSDSTGIAYVRFNNPAMPEIPIRTNFGIYGFPIRRIFVRWDAQAGKQINLLYGYGAQVVPPNQDITTIGSITNPVTLSTWAGINRQGSPGFMVARDAPAGGAGNFRQTQIFNPAGSGKTLLIDRVTVRSAAAALFQLRFHNAGFTLVGTAENKTLGGAVSSGELRDNLSAAPAGTIVDRIGTDAAVSRDRVFYEPVRVPEGFGFASLIDAANTGYHTSFEWREI